jgi:hypothetical protein
MAYTIGLKLPDGYRVPPHWHPRDASVIVVQGSFSIGLGEKVEPAQAQELTPGPACGCRRKYGTTNGRKRTWSFTSMASGHWIPYTSTLPTIHGKKPTKNQRREIRFHEANLSLSLWAIGAIEESKAMRYIVAVIRS